MQAPLPDDTAALLAEARWLRSMAGRLARDQAEADDVAQDTLALALEKRPDSLGGLRPWLARVAGRVARHRRRADARRGARESESWQPACSPSTAELFERIEAQERLVSVVRNLPAPYAEVVLRRYYEGQSADEIAAAMGSSAATTRSRLARGLTLLREALDGDPHASRTDVTKLLALAAGVPSTNQAPAGALLISMKASTQAAASIAALLLLLVAGIAVMAGPDESGIEGPESGTVGSAAPTIRTERMDAPTVAEPSAESDRKALGDMPTEDGKAAAPLNAPTPSVSTVRARLVDPQGAPLAGAQLSSIFKSGKPRGEGNFARADESGAVVLELEDDALRAWRTEVFPMVFSATFEGRATQFVTATPVWHGDSDLGDLELRPGAVISGVVVDEAGQQIPGALIYGEEAVVAGDLDVQRVCGPANEKARPRADADDAGRFECHGMAPGEVRLWVHARGYLWTLSEPVHVTAGQVLNVGRVVLEPVPAEHKIAGVVLRPEGGPAGGASVFFESQKGDGSVKTRSDGTFTIYPRSPFAMKISAQTPKGPYGMSEAVTASPGDRLELQLSKKQLIRVHVVDEQRRPVEAASLLTMASTPDQATSFGNGFDVIPGTDWIETDSSGQATLLVPGQAFAISASMDGYEFQRAGPFEPGEAPQELTVTLVKKPTLSGRVTHRGEPVAGAEIKTARRVPDFIPLEQGFPMRLFNGGGPSYRTDDQGRFDCPAQGENEGLTLLAIADGLATSEVELDVPPGEGIAGFEIKMTEGGTLRGTLLAPPGEDPRKLVVAASRGDGEVLWTRPDADGHYELHHLAPGPWRIEGRDREPAREMLSAANSEEDKDFKWNVDIREGETTSFDVDMRQLGDVEIHGQFTVDGVPVEGWVVTVATPIHATVEKSAPATKTGTDGRFLLVVRSGKYHLQMDGELPGGAKVKVLREVRLEGQRLDIDVQLATGQVEETIEGDAGTARFVRGNYYEGNREVTTVPVPEDRVLRARLPIGTSSLQTPEGNSRYDSWRYLRSLTVSR